MIDWGVSAKAEIERLFGVGRLKMPYARKIFWQCTNLRAVKSLKGDFRFRKLDSKVACEQALVHQKRGGQAEAASHGPQGGCVGTGERQLCGGNQRKGIKTQTS